MKNFDVTDDKMVKCLTLSHKVGGTSSFPMVQMILKLFEDEDSLKIGLVNKFNKMMLASDTAETSAAVQYIASKVYTASKKLPKVSLSLKV